MDEQGPRLDRVGETAYFTDVEGERYRVYDVAFGPPLAKPGKRRVMPLESPAANHRYFVSAGGVVRAYRFTKGEARELVALRLAQQLNGAGFAAMTPPDRGAVRPT